MTKSAEGGTLNTNDDDNGNTINDDDNANTTNETDSCEWAAPAPRIDSSDQ